MKSFEFSHKTHGASDYFWQRFWSIFPGALSWIVLLSVIALSFFKPLHAAIVIIAINIFWLLRIFYMTIFLALAYTVLAVEKGTDWAERCRMLERGEDARPEFRKRKYRALKSWKIGKWIDLNNQARELRRVLRNKTQIPAYDDVYHVVIIAAAKEGPEILEPGLQGLVKSQFPAEKILPVLAIEDRTGSSHRKMAETLQARYRKHFYDFLVISHPDGIPGEARVKGANVTYAARETAVYLKAKKIDFENVVVSCFDADTIASPEYFSALTYHFMRHPKRTRASFQPIPVYHNNIMDAPAISRVLETGSSFFQLIEATNPEKLVTFSSHSMSFKALVEIGYWPVDMISDDSAIFWKALLHYEGDYRVVPMYVTLSMDVVMADNFPKTIQHIYKQKRRWAWGVENFPIVMRGFMRRTKITFVQKLRYVIKLLEMHISWATLGFLITFVGWLPAIFTGQEFSNSVIFYNSSRISGLIFNLASSTFIITILLAQALLPRKKKKITVFRRLIYAAEWLLIPFVFTLLSSLPALDAQTRLMRGKMMEFFVTEKKRKPSS